MCSSTPSEGAAIQSSTEAKSSSTSAWTDAARQSVTTPRSLRMKGIVSGYRELTPEERTSGAVAASATDRLHGRKGVRIHTRAGSAEHSPFRATMPRAGGRSGHRSTGLRRTLLVFIRTQRVVRADQVDAEDELLVPFLVGLREAQ